MFICPTCMERFIDNGLAYSYGACELCGKRTLCVDIPSKYLQEKPSMFPDIEPQKGKK